MGWLTTRTLVGSRVRLEPLSLAHVPVLEEAAAERDLSTLWYTNVPSSAGVRAVVEERMARRDQGSWAPYVIFQAESSRALGMSGYLNIPPEVHRLEIGGTWMRVSAQRTGANVEAKLLLLEEAFEHLRCIAVEFRTHRLNAQSRRAIEALGAQLDGVLRNHFDAFDRPRDTCIYSITDGEWPTVKRHLQWRLSRFTGKCSPELEA